MTDLKAKALLIAGLVSMLAGPASAQADRRIADAYGKLPLSFEANAGQTDKRVEFLSRGKGYTLFLTQGEAVLALKHGANGNNVRMRLVGANQKVEAAGADRLPGTANYFIGNDPTKWHTGVLSYGKVKYAGVYHGVDLVYYGNQGKLEYDFVVAAGADPDRIALKVASGTKRSQLKTNASGDLVIAMDSGEARFRKPVAYQTNAKGDKQFVEAAYILKDNQISFWVAPYDRTKSLIIDPVLSYSTYLGGSGADEGVGGMAVDSAGNAFLTGQTTSLDFPTSNPEQSVNAGGAADAFVTKINAAGTGIVYSTYLGGNGSDTGLDIAVDSAGNAYIGGITWSSNFPTANPIQPALNGAEDAFVAKLNPSGNGLLYSTYLGGSSYDEGLAIAVDSFGNAYVVGDTTSSDFPLVGPIQGTLAGGRNGFVTKINSAGSALVYSTYLGGNYNEQFQGVAVDGSSNVYITGITYSTNFPVVNAIQPTYGGGSSDAFITKINAAGSALVYSTYLGGSGNDRGTGIALDSLGNAYVSGYTDSINFPTKRPLQPSNAGGGDAFVTKINAAGSALVYSTYLGGSGYEGAYGYPKSIAVDKFGNAFVAGATSSSDFPTVNPTQALNAGNGDAFVAKLNATGSALLFSSYLGGSGTEDATTGGSAVGVDAAGNIYVYGTTTSNDFPLMNPLQASNHGEPDLFITKIGSGVSLNPKKLTFPNQVIDTTSAAKTVTLANISSATLTITQITSSNPEFSVTNTCGTSVPSMGSCDIEVTFSPTASGTQTGSIKITDSELGSPQTIGLTGTGTDISLTPARLNFGNHTVGTTTVARTVTATNVGTTTVTISSITLAGTDPQDFEISANNCTTLAGGASCTVSVQFKPTATGARSATLNVNDDDAGSPQKMALSGTGM